MWINHGLMRPKDAVGMGNGVDPDQTTPGATLFAQTCMSENRIITINYSGTNRKAFLV